MKNKIFLSVFFLLCFVGVSHATCLHQHQKTKEEFIQKQKAFIIDEASLTEKEASDFFVVYYELQDKKRENQKAIGALMRKAKEELTEKEYGDILIEVYSLKKKNAELDLEYYYKFIDILPKKKVYEVFRSESKFQRHIIRDMHQNHNRQGNRGGKRR